jgi:hypothetical protein
VVGGEITVPQRGPQAKRSGLDFETRAEMKLTPSNLRAITGC